MIEFEKCTPGKLDPHLLDTLLTKYTRGDASVIAGAGIGEDAAVIDMGDRYLVVATDPITFTTKHIGYYAVHVNVNDVVCLGATPKYFFATLLLAENIKKSEIEEIFSQLANECRNQGIAYIGGHTEVTLGLQRSMVVGQIIAEVDKERLLSKQNIKSGDCIVQINPIPIEGTAILASEKSAELCKLFSEEFVQTCRDYLFNPGIAVRPAAKAAIQTGLVKALHDPTEGGLATAVYELAAAANVGCELEDDKVLYLSNGKLACDHFGLNPMGCIASGALLAAVSFKDAKTFVQYMQQAGYPAALIGRFVNATLGYSLIKEGKKQNLPLFAKDEITKIL